jgi:hypothetical protein
MASGSWYATCVVSLRNFWLVKKGTGSPMTATTAPIIKCPVCESSGAMLRHDLRAPLFYSCQNCMHEWQIDRAEEPPEAEPPVAERQQTRAVRSKPSGKQ